MATSSEPGIYINGVKFPSHKALQEVRADGRYKYVEDMITRKLKEVKLEDRPPLYRYYKDEYGLDAYQFYDGIADGESESFVRHIIDPLGGDDLYGEKGKFKLSTIIQQIDKTGSIYDGEYEKLKPLVIEANRKRELFMMKKRELKRQRELDAKLISETTFHIDKTALTNGPESVTDSTLNNSCNNNTTNLKKKTTNVIATNSTNSNNSNNVTINVDNVNLIVDGNQVNSLYKQDGPSVIKSFLSYFVIMDKDDQLTLIDHLQKIMDLTDFLESGESCENKSITDESEKNDNSKVNPIDNRAEPKNLKEDDINKVNPIDNRAEPKNLKQDNVEINEKIIQSDELDCPEDGERQSNIPNKFTHDNYINFEKVINEYTDSCGFIEKKTKKKAINLTTMYDLIRQNPDHEKIFMGIFGNKYSIKGNLTKSITELVTLPESKYYTQRDSFGDIIKGPKRASIIFIK